MHKLSYISGVQAERQLYCNAERQSAPRSATNSDSPRLQDHESAGKRVSSLTDELYSRLGHMRPSSNRIPEEDNTSSPSSARVD
jgi:hypothetical protein